MFPRYRVGTRSDFLVLCGVDSDIMKFPSPHVFEVPFRLDQTDSELRRAPELPHAPFWMNAAAEKKIDMFDKGASIRHIRASEAKGALEDGND